MSGPGMHGPSRSPYTLKTDVYMKIPRGKIKAEEGMKGKKSVVVAWGFKNHISHAAKPAGNLSGSYGKALFARRKIGRVFVREFRQVYLQQPQPWVSACAKLDNEVAPRKNRDPEVPKTILGPLGSGQRHIQSSIDKQDSLEGKSLYAVGFLCVPTRFSDRMCNVSGFTL
jgi:hypothetical protein